MNFQNFAILVIKKEANAFLIGLINFFFYFYQQLGCILILQMQGLIQNDVQMTFLRS